MTVSSIIEIAGEEVDLNSPCEVATALKKRKIAIASGASELIIRMGGEEVTFSRANISALDRLIAEYENQCSRSNRKTTGGRSRRIRFC